MKKVQLFLKLSVSDKLLFAEALVCVIMAKFLLLFVSLKICVTFADNRLGGTEKPSLEQLRQLKKAVHRTRYFMFWKNQCLVMSLASRWMLQRRHFSSVLSLGVTFDQNRKLVAHAWLTSNNFPVIEKSGNYHELYYF